MILSHDARVLLSTFSLSFLACTGSLFALDNAITFTEAHNDLFAQSYNIKAAEENVEGRRADTWQAGRYPNPILTVEGEYLGQNVGGNENELFVAIIQPVEFWGKRDARIRFADAVECESYWDLEAIKNEVSSDFLHAFVSVAAAQERIALATRQAAASQEVMAHVKFKSDAGKGSGLEIKKSEIAHNNTTIYISQQKAALQQQMRKLKAFWPCPPSFSAVDFSIYDLQPLPSLDNLTAFLENNPVLGKAQATTARACKNIELQRAERIPTVAFQVGVSTQKFTRDPALTIGVDIPLPLFDRNAGNIGSAMHDHTRAVYEQNAMMQKLAADLEITYSEWETAYEQSLLLKNELVPRAIESYEFSKQGYIEGKFNYLDFLDAQRTLLDAQQQYLDAVEEYHHKRADVLKLVMNCATTN